MENLWEQICFQLHIDKIQWSQNSSDRGLQSEMILTGLKAFTGELQKSFISWEWSCGRGLGLKYTAKNIKGTLN